jgi:hypothetical protein
MTVEGLLGGADAYTALTEVGAASDVAAPASTTPPTWIVPIIVETTIAYNTSVATTQHYGC